MSAKKETSRKSHVISPVLFISVEGEPMRFFVRPSRTKAQLQPYIKAGGGILCKEQEPGATLLLNPEDLPALSESDAHRYVSSQYIRDCIEKNMQLDLEDYRFSSEDVQKCFTSNSSRNVTGTPKGRLAYTPEENAAILKYVSKRKTEVGGNLLWQEMEKQLVTYHSWQSMKYHYKMHLAKREQEVEEEERTEKENKTDANPKPGESAQPETAEAQTSRSSEPEVPCLQPQTDDEPVPAESTQPETTEPQTLSSPQPESLPDASSQTKQKKRQTASPAPAQPQRRSTRRKLELEEPSGRQLRSSSSGTPQKLVPSPRPAKKAKPVTKPATQKATPVDEPGSKKARGRGEVVVVESRQEENGQAMPSEQAQAANTVVEKEAENRGKKTEKRKLGILEMATKEFEDGSESDQDETADLQNPAQTAAEQAKSTETPKETSAPAVSAASPQPGPAQAPIPALAPGPAQAPSPAQAPGPAHTPVPQETRTEAEASSSSSHCPEPACPVTASTASKPHLFIFDKESQDEDSQSVLDKITAPPSVPRPVKRKDAAISLTQEQLEEDKERLRGLMKQTNQDLVSVTKALLKTSGDFSAALQLLLSPSSFMRPFWNRHDDSLLRSADPEVRQELLDKYGEEHVAKRLMFLEVES